MLHLSLAPPAVCKHSMLPHGMARADGPLRAPCQHQAACLGPSAWGASSRLVVQITHLDDGAAFTQFLLTSTRLCRYLDLRGTAVDWDAVPESSMAGLGALWLGGQLRLAMPPGTTLGTLSSGSSDFNSAEHSVGSGSEDSYTNSSQVHLLCHSCACVAFDLQLARQACSAAKAFSAVCPKSHASQTQKPAGS